MPEIAGIAGAILTSLQMGVAVLASAVVAAAYGSVGIYAMLLPMLCFSVLATLAYVLMARPSVSSNAQ
jgi:hypothetical protein